MIKIKSFFVVLSVLLIACEQEDTLEMVSETEAPAMSQMSNIRSSSLVEHGNLQGWFDQITFTDQTDGSLNVRMEGGAKHRNNAALVSYSEVYENRENKWVKILTTDQHLIKDSEETGGFDYTLSLPKNLLVADPAESGFEIITVVASGDNPSERLMLNSLYSGKRATESTVSTGFSTLENSDFRFSIDILDDQSFSNDNILRFAGWLCEFGVNANNYNVTLQLFDVYGEFLDSYSYRAALPSEQAVKDACGTNVDHRFDGTFIHPNPSRTFIAKIYADELVLPGPGPRTLLTTQDCFTSRIGGSSSRILICRRSILL